MTRKFLSTLLLLSACDLSAGEADSEPDTAAARAVSDGLEVTVRLDAERYTTQPNTIRCIAAPCPSNAVAPVLNVALSVRNVSDQPITLELTSGQRFDLQVIGEDQSIVQTWSADKLFMMATGSVTLAPGESEDWATEMAFVPDLAGAFTLRATVVGASASPEVPFTVAMP